MKGGETMRDLLICEGACNPNIHTLDAQVLAFPKDDGQPRGTPVLWQEQRALRYTRHDHPSTAGPNYRVCTVCGTKRRFGRQW